MNDEIQGPKIDWLAISPEIALVAGVCVVLMAGLLRARFVRHTVVPLLSLVALGACAGLLIGTWGDNTAGHLRRAGDGRPDALPLAALRRGGDRRACCCRGARWRRARRGTASTTRCCCAAVLGMMVLAGATNLVTVFIGYELLSIPLYVLCATEMRRERSLESGLKYLIIGSVGSATLLYGLAFVYGATGATSFAGIAEGVHGDMATDVAPAHRPRADGGRARLQGLDRAVPPVDARRLRGRADADHRVHGGGDEGRRVRDHPALLRHRRDRRGRLVGAGAGDARGDHDRGRQRGRDRAVVAEAAARVLVGRAGGLHDRRRRR